MMRMTKCMDSETDEEREVDNERKHFWVHSIMNNPQHTRTQGDPLWLLCCLMRSPHSCRRSSVLTDGKTADTQSVLTIALGHSVVFDTLQFQGL